MQNTETFTEALAPNGIFYRQYGQNNAGPPLLMIMGYGGTMFAWPLEFIAKLADKFNVVIIDNRGTGRSAPLAKDIDLRMKHFAQDIKDLLIHLEHEKANLFGYSMGGCVALEFANLFPERTAKIILQSTSAGGALYTGSDPDVKERLANPRGSNFDEMLFDFFDLCMSNSALHKHKATLDKICNNARPYPTPLRVLQTQLVAFRNFDASGFAKTLKQETLIFHGKTDRILKVENGQKLHENIPNSQSVLFEDCGHCPHIEYEAEVIVEVQNFLL